jgi:hypothetical protein
MCTVHEQGVEFLPSGWQTEAEMKGTAMVDDRPISYLRARPLRCAIRFHRWTPWTWTVARRYVPESGGEGFIAVTGKQERRCLLCGHGENRSLKEELIPAYRAPITDFERKHLRTLPLLDVVDGDLFATRDRFHWNAHPNPSRLSCRFGLHFGLRRRPWYTCSGCGLRSRGVI